MKRMGYLAAILAASVGASLLLLGEAGCRGTVISAGVNVPVGGYDYDYYPNEEVYFYPTGHVYYWHETDGWHHGHDAPANFHLAHENHVPVHLNTERPYEMHQQVRSAHPPEHHEEDEHH